MFSDTSVIITTWSPHLWDQTLYLKEGQSVLSVLPGSLFHCKYCRRAYIWITSASQQQEVMGQFLIPLGPSGRRTLFIRHTWLLVAFVALCYTNTFVLFTVCCDHCLYSPPQCVVMCVLCANQKGRACTFYHFLAEMVTSATSVSSASPHLCFVLFFLTFFGGFLCLYCLASTAED